MATTKRRAKEPEGTPEARAADPPSGRDAPGFPIVGIGASAGGLAAFEAFFSGMPADTDPGMAFVLVQHLAPDHKSILSELVKRYTRMEVFEVADGMAVKPNCAYIIPPNRDMALLNGTLQLLEPAAPRGHRLPIDFFFRSLAQDQRERAIGIVLSGTGSDGTQGVRAIKGEGGMAMAQNPKSTEYDGMPRSAIATGLVDFVLPPAEMPAQLIAYVAHAFGRSSLPVSPAAPKAEDALKKIFLLLRAQTGHDFSQYKRSTVVRRVERRMAVHQIERLEEYVRYLQQTPADVEALFRDLLIGVTSFFRDPEAFGALQEQAIPRLFAGKPTGALIRVWVPGCSTGEEAYSLAILLQERMEELKQSFKLQVFATDIDRRRHRMRTRRHLPGQHCRRHLAGTAGALFLPGAGWQRLPHPKKHPRQGDLFRAGRDQRPAVLQTRPDQLPQSVDLYGRGTAEEAHPLVSLCVEPGRHAFPGHVGDRGRVRGPLCARWIASRSCISAERRLPAHTALGFSRLPPEDGPVARPAGKAPGESKLPVRELTERALLQQYAPPGALVNERGDIFYLPRPHRQVPGTGSGRGWHEHPEDGP